MHQIQCILTEEATLIISLQTRKTGQIAPTNLRITREVFHVRLNLRLKTISHILAGYTAWIWALLHHLGFWGVFVIAFADSALLGMPVDAIVATYVYHDRRLLLFYVALASVGSALGSIPLYIIGYEGGEKLLRKRISEERFQRIHRSFEQHEFWALMFPGMLPPPMPFKIFVVGAAISEMSFKKFFAAVVAGRCVRFLVLSLLVLYFGPQIVGFMGNIVTRHLAVLLGVIAGAAMIWLAIRKVRRRKRAAAQEAQNSG